MKNNKRFWDVYSRMEVSDSEFLEIAAAIVGKSDEEANATLEKYAEKIEKNNQIREHPLMTK